MRAREPVRVEPGSGSSLFRPPSEVKSTVSYPGAATHGNGVCPDCPHLLTAGSSEYSFSRLTISTIQLVTSDVFPQSPLGFIRDAFPDNPLGRRLGVGFGCNGRSRDFRSEPRGLSRCPRCQAGRGHPSDFPCNTARRNRSSHRNKYRLDNQRWLVSVPALPRYRREQPTAARSARSR